MTKYISIKVILDDLLDNPLLQNLTLERVVSYTVDFIRKVGMPKVYENKVTTLDIKDYRAVLPCDFHKIIQVREVGPSEALVLRESTDSFHFAKKKGPSYSLTYKIQGRVIYTSFKEGQVELSYESIPVDKDGYPLIPDNSSFKEALELYITKKKYRVLLDTGKIRGDIYTSLCQEYAFAVGQAQNSLIMPSLDEMESLSNMWNSILPHTHEHSTGFLNLGTKETIRNQ